MKWIIVAIAVFIGPYTYLTLHYRKPGPAYAPYADNKDRANTSRLLDAGYQRIALEFQESAPDTPPTWDTTPTAEIWPTGAKQVPEGVPVDLADALIDDPHLLPSFSSVAATLIPKSDSPIVIIFPSNPGQVGAELQAVHAYRRSELLVIVPELSDVTNSSGDSTLTIAYRIVIPPGSLPPGHYRVRLAGAESSREWEMQVN